MQKQKVYIQGILHVIIVIVMESKSMLNVYALEIPRLWSSKTWKLRKFAKFTLFMGLDMFS